MGVVACFVPLVLAFLLTKAEAALSMQPTRPHAHRPTLLDTGVANKVYVEAPGRLSAAEDMRLELAMETQWWEEAIAGVEGTFKGVPSFLLETQALGQIAKGAEKTAAEHARKKAADRAKVTAVQRENAIQNEDILKAPRVTATLSLNRTSMTAQAEALQRLLVHMTSNVAKFNERERRQTEKNRQERERVAAQLTRYKAEVRMANITSFERELLVNQSKMAQDELDYWHNDLELQHAQFYNSLKLTDGLMNRIKLGLNIYKHTLAGRKVDKKTLKDLASTITAPQAFAQMKACVTVFRKAMHKLLQQGLRIAIRRRNHALVDTSGRVALAS